MLKPFCQAAALILLCALLVYAPEIYTAVSGPFALSTPERVLLRVVLCTQDDETLSSFYTALTGYQRSHPAVHLRIVRTDSAHLYTLDAPLPDVYLLTESDFSTPQALFWPLGSAEEASASLGVFQGARYALVYTPDAGSPLLCAVSAQSQTRDTALDFIAYFHEIPPNPPGKS